MKVAMVVHNNVIRDARVIKEATTLASAGHDVTVYGLTADQDETATELTVGTACVPVKLTLRPPAGSVPDLLMQLPGQEREDCRSLSQAFRQLMEMRNVDEAGRIQRSFTHQGALLAQAVIRDAVPDVVHIHDHIALTAASIYKTWLGVPLIWDAHEIYEDFAGHDDARKPVNAAIIAANSPLVNHFITISESFQTFYGETYRQLPKAIVLPNASLLVDRPAYDGRLHAAAGLPLDRKILLFQGGFAPFRGIERLVRAAPLLGDEWTIVLMGWGPLQGTVEEISEYQPLAQDGTRRVIVIPGVPQDELPFWTAGATLGAIPYESVGKNHLYCTPNKLWEYPLAGVPILATDLVEIGKLVREYGTGKLLPRSFDEASIAEVVNAIDENELTALREACNAFSKVHNWGTFSNRLVDLYASISDATAVELDLPSRIEALTGGRLETGPDTVESSPSVSKKHIESGTTKGFGSVAWRRFKKITGFGRLKSKIAERDRRILQQEREIKKHTQTINAQKRSLEKSGVDLKKATGRTSELEGRIEKLKETNEQLRQMHSRLKETNVQLRQKYRDARTDKRDASTSDHNTAEGMDQFFAANTSAEPYERFGQALHRLLDDKHISLENKAVLDVGVGPGLMLKSLLGVVRPASVEGLDFSAVAVQQAQQNIPYGVFEVGDVYQPIPHRGDFVLCTEVLEHLDDPAAALKNIMKTVLPGGQLLLTVPDGRVDFSLLHVNFWSPESWRFFIEGIVGSDAADIGQFRVTDESAYANNYAILSL